jgi:Flp pilus assembly protein TadG
LDTLGCQRRTQGGGHGSGGSGQGLVEFALVAPFFFLLVFMIFEGALFMNAQATIDNATREGARAAALCGSATIYTYQGVTTSTGCNSLAENVVYAHLGILTALYPQNPTVSTSCPLSNSCAPTNPVKVQTIYSYRYLIPSLLGIGPVTNINSTAQEVSQQ